jgi:acyl-CoA reductase-like NAD-dependent aldehyde dehydrogenase
MAEVFRTISPVDGRVLVERPYAGPAALDRALHAARRAFEGWRHVPLEERAELVNAWVQAVVAKAPILAEELTWQMGRPLSQTPGELRGSRTARTR